MSESHTLNCSARMVWVVAGIILACHPPIPPSHQPEVATVPQALSSCVFESRQVPQDSIRLPGAGTPRESPILRISRETPGGMTNLYAALDGGMEIQMVDTSQADTVRAALRAAFAAQQSPDERATFAQRLAAARPKQAAWSLAQLSDWLGFITAILLPDALREGVQLDGTGLAPWRVRIVVYIRTEKARAWVEGRLAGARIPCGLVETVLGGPVQISTITESLGAKAGER